MRWRGMLVVAIGMLLVQATWGAEAKSAEMPAVEFFTKLRMDYAKRPNFNPRWK